LGYDYTNIPAFGHDPERLHKIVFNEFLLESPDFLVTSAGVNGWLFKMSATELLRAVQQFPNVMVSKVKQKTTVEGTNKHKNMEYYFGKRPIASVDYYNEHKEEFKKAEEEALANEAYVRSLYCDDPVEDESIDYILPPTFFRRFHPQPTMSPDPVVVV
jgi:hypothetical protein